MTSHFTTYVVTINIYTPQPNWQEDKVETVVRKFPRWLSGVQMTKMMFCELMLAEYPMSSVEVVNVENQ